MKLLVLLLVLLLAVWLWRRGRRDDASAARPPGRAQPMIACTHCGVHVPESAAVRGRSGVYCGTAHRREAGDG